MCFTGTTRWINTNYHCYEVESETVLFFKNILWTKISTAACICILPPVVNILLNYFSTTFTVAIVLCMATCLYCISDDGNICLLWKIATNVLRSELCILTYIWLWSKPFHRNSGCKFRVCFLLKDQLRSQSQAFLLLDPPLFSLSTLTSLPVPPEEKHCHSLILPPSRFQHGNGVFRVMFTVSGFPHSIFGM